MNKKLFTLTALILAFGLNACQQGSISDTDLQAKFKEYVKLHPETTWEQFLTKTQ